MNRFRILLGDIDGKVDVYVALPEKMDTDDHLDFEEKLSYFLENYFRCKARPWYQDPVLESHINKYNLEVKIQEWLTRRKRTMDPSNGCCHLARQIAEELLARERDVQEVLCKICDEDGDF